MYEKKQMSTWHRNSVGRVTVGLKNDVTVADPVLEVVHHDADDGEASFPSTMEPEAI